MPDKPQAVAPDVHKVWWAPVVDFGVRSLVGTLIFVAIFVPAVALNVAVHAAEERWTISRWLVWTATSAEFMLVATDIYLYGVFLWKHGARAARAM